MTQHDRLRAAPVVLQDVIRARRARLTNGVGYADGIMDARRREIAALELALRVTMAAAGSPEEFAVWYRMKTGAPL